MSIINNMPTKSGMTINGIIEEYYVYAGKNISAGDFVEFINGVAGSVDYGTSSDTKISALASTEDNSAIQLSNSNVFMVYPNNDGYLYGIVLTINGVTINVGTETQLSTNSQSGYGTSMVSLNNSEIFIAHSYGSSYQLYGMIVSIQGTTITVKVDSVITAMSYYGRRTSSILLENGNILIVHSRTSNYYLGACIVSINGTTIIRESNVLLEEEEEASYSMSPIVLENNKICIINGRNTRVYGMICTVEGTTINYEDNQYLVSNNRSGLHLSAVKLSDNNIFIAHCWSDSYYLYGTVCTVSGTMITAGTNTALVTARAGSHISTTLLKSGKVFVAHGQNSSSIADDLYGLIVMVHNTTITVGENIALSVTEESEGYAVKALTLSNGSIFLTHAINNSNCDIYGQIWGVDETNNIPTNKVILTTYETQVQKTTKSSFDGIAKTGGVGGTSAAHRDKVSIYTK